MDDSSFTVRISYNKLMRCIDGECYLDYWRGYKKDEVKVWNLDVNFGKSLLKIAERARAIIKGEKTTTIIFGPSGEYYLKTKNLSFGVDDEYMVILGEKLDGGHSVMIKPDRLDIIVNTLSSWMEGKQPKNAKRLKSGGELSEVHQIAYVQLRNKIRQEKCYGCKHNRPSQKEHPCMMEPDFFDDTDDSAIEGPMHKMCGALSFFMWREANPNLADNHDGVHNVLSTHLPKLVAPTGLEIISLEKEMSIGAVDSSKLEAVNKIIDFLY